MGTGRPITEGVVSSFDIGAATGVVTADDGTAYPFHCIEIADGTRTIEEGARVSFERLARFGSYQAAAIRQ